MWPKNQSVRVLSHHSSIHAGSTEIPVFAPRSIRSTGFLLISFGMSLSIVTAIVWLMHALISNQDAVLDRETASHYLDFVTLNPVEPEPPKRREPPVKPDYQDPPKSVRLVPGFDGPSTIGIPIPPVNKSSVMPTSPTGIVAITHREAMPLAEVQPGYPPRLLDRGIQGHCTVSYTISASGATKNARVNTADCTHESFGRAAIKAVAKFKYAPRIVDGEPVAIANQQKRFRFSID